MNPLWWLLYPLRLVRPGIPGVDYSLELTMKKEPAADAANHPTEDDVTTGMPSSQPPTVEPVQEVGQTGYARTRATMEHAEGAPRPWPPTSDPDKSANLPGESRAPADRSRSPVLAPRSAWPSSTSSDQEARLWRPSGRHDHDDDLVVTMDRRDERSWKGKAKGLARGRGYWTLMQKGKGEPLHRVWQPCSSSSRSPSTSPAADLGELL